MKVSSVRCDFCGQASKEMGTLTVPMTTDEIALKKRTDDGGKKPVEEVLFYGLLWGAPAESTKAKTYDICRGCGDGIVRARMASIVKLRAAMAADEV